MIATGQVRAVDEVKLEVIKQDDDAAEWAKRQAGLFVPLTADIQLATKALLEVHPRLLGVGGSSPRNGADAFVIGLAVAKGGTVVTRETPRNIKKPRIPDVCEAMGVPWRTLPQLVDDQGWTASMG